jgi:hypothetical protein
MLKDRIVLLDQDVEKLKARCGKLYLQIAVQGRHDGETQALYDENIEKLSKMLTEQVVINDMIKAGHP